MPAYGPDVVLQSPAFIHPTAQLYGKVTVASNASVWCNVVARAEMHEIVIGPYSNIQDFVMLHIGATTGTYIGSHTSVTHHCTLHGCKIGDNCLIGINATIMDGCEIGDNCIIAGHSLLKEGTIIPDNSVVTGTPGTVKRVENNYVRNRVNAFIYFRNALAYRDSRHREWDGPAFAAELQSEIARLQAEFAGLTQTGD